MADDGTPTDDQTGSDDAQTFTQADVDRIIKERLARVKSEPPADYHDLKAKAAKLDELEAANQSELEKLLARAEAAERKAAEADERVRRSNLRSAVTAAASAAGAVDMDAVFALLPQDAVTFGDDGQVTGADEAVKALLESKPYLVGQPNPPAKPQGSTDGGPRSSGTDAARQLTRDDITRLSDDEFAKAMADGRFSDLLSGNA